MLFGPPPRTQPEGPPSPSSALQLVAGRHLGPGPLAPWALWAPWASWVPLASYLFFSPAAWSPQPGGLLWPPRRPESCRPKVGAGRGFLRGTGPGARWEEEEWGPRRRRPCPRRAPGGEGLWRPGAARERERPQRQAGGTGQPRWPCTGGARGGLWRGRGSAELRAGGRTGRRGRAAPGVGGALVGAPGRRGGAARAVWRWWYSGEHSCLPSS